MFVRSLFALLLCLAAAARAVASCGCASPEDRVKLGFRQVSQFAGKITTKFYVGGQEVVEARRTYTAGTVAYNSENEFYYAASYGCGEFSDTVFITATVGQEIEVVTSFINDSENPGYTEIAPVEAGVFTVLAMPSAKCLDHYVALAGTASQRIIPGVRMIVPDLETNTIVDRYVTRRSGGDHSAAGASAGPTTGQLTAPPDKSDHLDAQPVGSLCEAASASVGSFSLTGASLEENDSATRTAAGDDSAEIGAVSKKKKAAVKSGMVGRSPAPAAGGLPVVDPWSVGEAKSAPVGPDFWPKQLRRGAASDRHDPVAEPAALASAALHASAPAGALALKGKAKPLASSLRQSRTASTTESMFVASASDSLVGEPQAVTTASATPGGVAQAGIGSLNLPISLGYRQGSLLYVASAINALAYSPANLHLSKDANPVVEIKDGFGALRQAWLPELFLDVRTLSSSAFEARLYLHSQVGAFDGTLYPIISDVPFCTWRIENPDAASSDRIRFIENRNGRTTTHLARWQVASGDNAGVMTLALNNEAIIETRTY